MVFHVSTAYYQGSSLEVILSHGFQTCLDPWALRFSWRCSIGALLLGECTGQRGQSCEALEWVWVRALGPPHESSYFVYWAVTYNFIKVAGSKAFSTTKTLIT